MIGLESRGLGITENLRLILDEMDIGADGVFLPTTYLTALLADFDERGSDFDHVCGRKWFDIECQANGCQSLFLNEAREEIARLRQWIDELQSGMFVNCVYCGHCYGPDSEAPRSMAEVLKQHVERCPEHPMSALLRESEELRAELRYVVSDLNRALRGE